MLNNAKNFVIKGTSFVGRSLYLDMQATTPLDPRVLDKMLPFYLEKFGNSHSRTHMFGWEGEEAVENSRESVASLINADGKDIIFTSGATESNNIAIKGVPLFRKDKQSHIITTQTEHKCILDSCRWLTSNFNNVKVTYLPVKSDGLVDLKLLEESITENTCLVSVMAVNNEIGVIQPLKQIGELCRKRGVYFHTDAAQAFGKIPIDVKDMKIDILSFSGHKIYGPKGIGGLYIGRKPRVRLNSVISGGGQERGFRSGTLPVPLIVGMGEASRVAKQEMSCDTKHVTKLSNKLYNNITSSLPLVHLNGSKEFRYPGNLNLSFEAVEGESLMMALKEVALSSGSACTSGSLEPSYVLRALGSREDLAHTSLRFGFGRFTTEEEIDFVSDLVVQKVTMLRELSPLWDMIQEGVDLNSIKWS
jgi:cysteine desulfurase